MAVDDEDEVAQFDDRSYSLYRDGDMDRMLKNIVDDTGKYLLFKLKTVMTNMGKYATGEMHDSWEYDPEIQVVGNTDEGMLGVEFGTPPGHVVPVEELEKWAVHKLKFGKPAAAVIARRIQKKIEKDGIPETRLTFLTIEDAVAEGWLAWSNTG